MKKEVDFIAEFEKEDAELQKEDGTPCSSTEGEYFTL